MWPYTECEWNDITYGIKKRVKKISKFRKYKTLVLMSVVPTLTLIWFLAHLI